MATRKVINEILAKPSPHPVTGKSEASIWQECRAWHVSQGEDRVLAGERAWLHINPEGGDCSYLVLPLDPEAVPPPKPTRSRVPLTRDQVREAYAGHRASYLQQCETHAREDCDPAGCPDVRLYHVLSRARHERACHSCGSGFMASRTDARYCSSRCRERARTGARAPALV